MLGVVAVLTGNAMLLVVSEKRARPMTRTTGTRCDPRSAIDPLQSGSAGQGLTTRPSLNSRGSSDTSGPRAGCWQATAACLPGSGQRLAELGRQGLIGGLELLPPR